MTSLTFTTEYAAPHSNAPSNGFLPKPIKLDNIPWEVCEKAFIELMAIKEEFKDWKEDALSRNLHRFILDVDRLKSIPIIDRKKCKLQLEELLNNLNACIFVNPLNEMLPLLAPLLDRTWVWDKWSLAEFQSLTERKDSPFDQKPILAKPHSFAMVVMNKWKSVFKEQKSNHSPRFTLLPKGSTQVKDTPESRKEYSGYFDYLAGHYITMQQMRDLQFTMKIMGEEFDEIVVQSKEITEEETQLNIERLNAMNMIFKEGLAAANTAHETNTTRLEVKQKALNEKQAVLESEQAKLKKETAEQKQQLIHLFWELECRRRELAALASRDGGGCNIL